MKYSDGEEHNIGRALIFHSSTTETKGAGGAKTDEDEEEARLLKEIGI